ncbi:MAG: type IV toxin-antitoxin system AbiEi family antitoxin domain-containing protein, partial [Gemmatimonadaceae bacterium]
LERRLARRAASQSGLVTRRQLLAIGFTDHQIRSRVNGARLIVLHRSVYLVAGAPLNDAVWLQVATLATDCVASHRSAAHLLGLIDSRPSRPEITTDSGGSACAPFITHRSGDLLSRDTTTINGVPATNATRTLIDLASVVGRGALETALERALLARNTTLDRLSRRFFELAAKGRPGIAAMRSLLVERDPTQAPAESDLETLLSKILREGGLPTPVRQFEVVVAGQRFYLDAAYPELMIFLEGDGFGVHSQRGPFERDRSRQNLLVLAGWLPLRFTWPRLCRSPEGVVSEVRAARILRQRMFS